MASSTAESLHVVSDNSLKNTSAERERTVRTGLGGQRIDRGRGELQQLTHVRRGGYLHRVAALRVAPLVLESAAMRA